MPKQAAKLPWIGKDESASVQLQHQMIVLSLSEA